MSSASNGDLTKMPLQNHRGSCFTGYSKFDVFPKTQKHFHFILRSSYHHPARQQNEQLKWMLLHNIIRSGQDKRPDTDGCNSHNAVEITLWHLIMRKCRPCIVTKGCIVVIKQNNISLSCSTIQYNTIQLTTRNAYIIQHFCFSK